MSTVSVRLPDSLHETIRSLAKEENVSINQLITLALAEKVSALKTEEFFLRRGKGGSRRKFLKALSKVADKEPEERDRF